MSLSDPVADMLTRIRNALTAGQEAMNVPASRICTGVCGVLKEEGYIKDFKPVEDDKQGQIRIYLKYGPSGEKIITELTRVSRPGRRVYSSVDSLPRPLEGMGISIVSTSRGILSDRQCREQKVGGEVICTVS
ncbi:MAG: 30S ribosomal protein S8 [Planctomycetes bacterium]|nr:30S ribosomal protein S8 [Planctomycetota bacterium]